MNTVTAPVAPGKLGTALDPAQVLTYLQDLRTWLAARRRELDELDRAAQESEQGATLTGDIVLSMTLWQAVTERLALLDQVWDSGRVGLAERERLSSLVWGRLDSTVGPISGGSASIAGMNLSLPEACRLSDALAASLRTRVAMDPQTDALTMRVRALRAQMERLRDQIQLESGPDFEAARVRLGGLVSRTDEIVQRLERGGDVGGLVGPLEIEASTWERDLIVGGQRRRENGARRAEALATRERLAARRPALVALADQTAAEVAEAPKYAVPDVMALGDVPADPAQLDAYVERLGLVEKACAQLETAYREAGARLRELEDRLETAHQRASAASADDDLATTYDLARRTLDRRPVSTAVAGPLVDAYIAQVAALQGGQR